MGKRLVLATRKSPLALAQAGLVAEFLKDRLGASCELLKVVTTGDRQAEWSLEAKGGKGLFTKELESALLRGEADLAVHSAKDLPGETEPGLATAGYLPRADPRDMLILRDGISTPASIATGSPRRRLQAEKLFPGVAFTEIRGNVDTRLKKIAEQRVADATILAAAGLERLALRSWPGAQFRAFGVDQMVPAVGQGAIAVQCRAADIDGYAGVFDRATAVGLELERAVQSALGGGCHTALGAYATGGTLHLFHESTGLRAIAVGPSEFDRPAEAADRILRELRLL